MLFRSHGASTIKLMTLPPIFLQAFATTVTKNHCLDKLKLKKETETIDNHYAVAARDNPHLQLERKNTEQALKHIIGTLPQLQQQIITMKDVEDDLL